MAYHQPFQIIAFHSCDREVGLRIINGDDQLISSENPWDWLGPGVYFWEENPGRALEYAVEVANRVQKNKKPITTPFVLGAIIELGNCLNLLEPASINIVKEAHSGLVQMSEKSGLPLPKNKDANRQLDCGVIKYVHQTNVEKGLPKYDTIRSAFLEGEKIYPDSNFTSRLHIEICVLNPLMIKGYFLPRPLHEFNPYLTSSFEINPDVNK